LHQKKRQELIKQISNIFTQLSTEEKQDILSEVLKKRIGMPISVFKANLSSLEIITKYLREVENKPFKEISKILNRKLSTLYNTYNNSKIKFKKSLDVSDNSITIPFDIFKDRKYSILESIVAYLKDKEFSFTQISILLNKNYNTIKTVYRRYKMKK
jgi:hypothetical protein